MLMDLLIILIVAVIVLVGIRQGAIRQIIGLIGITIGIILATKFYVSLGSLIIKIGHPNLLTADLLAWLIICLVTYLLIKIPSLLLEKKLPGNVIKGKWDKILGGIFSGLKALLIIMVTLLLVDLMINIQLTNMELSGLPKDGISPAEKAEKNLNGSFIASTLVKYNPLKELKIVKSIKYYTKLPNKPEDLEKIAQDEKVKKLLENEKIKTLVTDETVQKAIADKNYGQLLQNEKILQIMNDKELLGILLSVGFENNSADEKVKK
jgi:membrane protein required for colicin V production